MKSRYDHAGWRKDLAARVRGMRDVVKRLEFDPKNRSLKANFASHVEALRDRVAVLLSSAEHGRLRATAAEISELRSLSKEFVK